MVDGTFPSIVKRLSQHPLSPVPLVAVCVGFWLPADFMSDFNTLLAITTTIGRFYVIATAILLQAILAIFGAFLIYIAAALFSALFRISFQKAARTAISFATCVALLAPTLHALRADLFISILIKRQLVMFVTATICVICASWMVRRRVYLNRFLLAPMLLTCLLIPISLVLVMREAIQTASTPGDRAVYSAAIRNDKLPDIILFTIDTLSARHLHTYGYERPTSPNLDAFSADAIIFDNFYANANWTRPGVASILNGVRPWTHEGDVDIPSHGLTGRQNLINILPAAGYQVDIVQSNDYADFSAQGIKRPAQGHEIFLDCCYRFFHWIPIDRLPSATIAAHTFGLFRRVELIEYDFFRRSEGKSLPYLSTSEALLRNASSQRPLFFWIHVVVPHDPYAASAPFLGSFDNSQDARSARTSDAYTNFANHINQKRQDLLRARYDEAILMTDDLFGKFIQILKQQGRFDHSLIVVTADHGESFLPVYGLHGGPLLTEELIRVPCFIKPPVPFTPKHESLLMEQADLVPTILSYAGLPVSAGSEGHAYPGKPDNLPIFSMNRDFKANEKTLNVAMREGDWKYVVHFGRWKYPWPRRELYNLASDPKEQVNLVSSQQERAASMQQRVLAEISQHGISLSGYQP